jgi:hypothetical protein
MNPFGGCDKLKAILLRSETIVYANRAELAPTLDNGTGYIYVPRSLIEDYKVATNWSTHAAQFRALEDYTIDGTVAGDFALWSVANNLAGVSNSNAAEEAFRSYTATLTPIGDNTIGEVTITMGGVDVTAEVYDPETGVINIPTVTGSIEITAKIELSAGMLYNLPEPTTFNGTSDYIDTWIKLFDTAKDFTIVCTADFSALANNICLFHCMNEATPYPGLSVDGQSGVRICYTGAASLVTSISNKTTVSTLIIRYKAGVLDAIRYRDTSGAIVTVNHNTSAKYTAVNQNLLLGAYQTTAGVKGRYFKGTISSFTVYDSCMSDDEIAILLGG